MTVRWDDPEEVGQRGHSSTDTLQMDYGKTAKTCPNHLHTVRLSCHNNAPLRSSGRHNASQQCCGHREWGHVPS